MRASTAKPSARTKLLDAALAVVRAKGYAGTTVDDLCAQAGVTKGAFFHHFESKEALAVSAAEHWSRVTNALFEKAPYHRHADPLARVLGYVDFRKSLLQGAPAEFSCFAGTMVQEAFGESPAIRDACRASIFGHASDLARDIQAAKKAYAPGATWTATSLALHIQSVIQGAFVIAKADSGATTAAASLDHLHRYLSLLFSSSPQTDPQPQRKKKPA